MNKKQKNKIYEIIGRIFIFLIFYTLLILLGVWAFMQNTIY